jgi:hypothetical protein
VRAEGPIGGDIGLGEPASRREGCVNRGRQITPSVGCDEPLHLVEALVEEAQLQRFTQRSRCDAEAQLLELALHRIEGVAGKG